jgi:hypothetical protein
MLPASISAQRIADLRKTAQHAFEHRQKKGKVRPARSASTYGEEEKKSGPAGSASTYGLACN